MQELTIIIPLYNTEKYIEQCIRSVIVQKYPVADIIIVDDGSTDSSADICEKYALIDNRIKVIHQENKGLSGARYTGLKCCKTKYATFVDADDFIKENAYDSAIEAMQNDVDMIFYEISRYYDDSNIKREHHVLKQGLYTHDKIEREVYPKLIWDFDRNTPGIECSLCVRIVKKELLLEVYQNMPEKSFYYGEDAAITYPLYNKICTMEVVSESFYMHRQREMGSLSYIRSADYFEELFRLYQHLKINCSDKIYFLKQIEYYYMYAVELRKNIYNDYKYLRDFIFPFDKVPYERNVVLYGAGEVGKAYYSQLNKLKYCRRLWWIDQKADCIMDDRVMNIQCIDTISFDYVVIGIENKNICEEVERMLVERGVDYAKIVF